MNNSLYTKFDAMETSELMELRDQFAHRIASMQKIEDLVELTDSFDIVSEILAKRANGSK